jgi:hypothetical protein
MSDNTQLVRTFSELLELLKRDGVPHEANPETSEVVIPTQRGPLESALCRLNPALVVAGFEIAYERRRVGFRTTLPLQPRGGILPDEIQTYFRITVKTAADFLPTLSRVAAGLGNPHNVLEDAQTDLAAGRNGSGPGALNTY